MSQGTNKCSDTLDKIIIKVKISECIDVNKVLFSSGVITCGCAA